MKRTLLGTSALVAGASLVAGAAVAAEPPTLTVSGGMAYELIWNSGDRQVPGTGLNLTANEQQGELHWRVRGVADNGLEYGFMIDYRYMNNGPGAGTFDETWMDFSGSWGRLYLGAEDAVTDLVAGTHATAVQVGTWGTDGNNALRHVDFIGLDSQLHYYQSHAAHTSDQNKVGYVSPSFSGFQVGVSYTPNGTEGQQAGRDNFGGQPFQSDNTWDVAASWSGSFDDVSLKFDAAYGRGRDNSGVGGIEKKNIKGTQIGGRVGFAGFQVAAGYVDSFKSRCTVGVGGCDAGSGWSVGASYNFGPTWVSASWQESRSDLNGTGRKDKSDIFHAGVQHRIAEGLSVYANYYNMDLVRDGGTAAGGAENEANVLILGTRITF